MVLPLLAGCLALTLVAATLLTVFTVGQGPVSGPLTHPGTVRSSAGSPATGGSGTGVSMAPATGTRGGMLPDTPVDVDGQQEYLSDLTGPGLYVVVLALIPPRCQCLRDLRQLTSEALSGGAQPYLVGIRGETVSQFERSDRARPRARGRGQREHAAAALPGRSDADRRPGGPGRLGRQPRDRPPRFPDQGGGPLDGVRACRAISVPAGRRSQRRPPPGRAGPGGHRRACSRGVVSPPLPRADTLCRVPARARVDPEESTQ